MTEIDSNEYNIVVISGHYPKNTIYANLTKQTVEKYCKKHNYPFYYDDTEPLEKEVHSLHFRRSLIIQDAYVKYPNAKWFLWLDSDIYVNVNKINSTIESFIDLTNDNILYHTFHEAPWGCYPINTGVKFVNRKAIEHEKEIWNVRNNSPWNTFPFEQKTLYEYIFPRIEGQYIIHDPYVLNCIIKAYPYNVEDALFVHMCGTPEDERNDIITNYMNRVGYLKDV